MRRLAFLATVIFTLAAGCGIAEKSAEGTTAQTNGVMPNIFQKKQPPTPLIQLPVPIAPGSIGVGPVFLDNRSVLFAATGADASGVGVASNDGTLKFTPVETGAGRHVFEDLTVGADANLWISAVGPSSAIARVTPGGTLTEFPVSGIPGSIIRGPDSRAWFTDNVTSGDSTTVSYVGAIDVSGNITYYKIPGSYKARSIIYPNYGTNRLMWLTASSPAGQSNGGVVDTVDASGNFAQVYVVPAGSYPDAMALNNGAVWFTEHPSSHSMNSGAIVELTLSGTSMTFATPVIPLALTGDPNGMWFTACATSSCPQGSWLIDFLKPNGHVSTAFTANSVAGLNQIVLGIDGNLWAGDRAADVDIFVRHLVSVSPTTLTMTVGQTQYVTGTLTPPNESLHASSTNNNVATISIYPNGNQFTVTATGTGHCYLYIRTSNNYNYARVSATVQ